MTVALGRSGTGFAVRIAQAPAKMGDFLGPKNEEYAESKIPDCCCKLDGCLSGTQMTLVLNGKGLLLECSNPKIEDKQVPGIF